MHGGLGCRRGTRAVPFSVSHALPHTVKKSSFKRRVHFRSAEMCGRTNGFSDQVIWFASMPTRTFSRFLHRPLLASGTQVRH